MQHYTLWTAEIPHLEPFSKAPEKVQSNVHKYTETLSGWYVEAS